MNSCNINKRLKGFTVLELLVGMIATSIVIAAVFSAYHIISSQGLIYREKSKSVTDLSLFHSRITKDFHEAPIITRTEEGFALTAYLPDQDEEYGISSPPPLKYEFHKEYTLRKSGGHTDTFFVNVHSHRLFDHGELLTGDSQNADEIWIAFGDEKNEMILRKCIDAKTALIGESEEWMK